MMLVTGITPRLLFGFPQIGQEMQAFISFLPGEEQTTSTPFLQ